MILFQKKESHKERLIIKGYTQQEEIDYNEIFSAVIKHSSILYFATFIYTIWFRISSNGCHNLLLWFERGYLYNPDSPKATRK